MNKIKELIKKYREVIMYLVFGVLTTLVGFGVKFGILAVWKIAFNIHPTDTDSVTYLSGAFIAQAISWVAAVLFAFFTNRAWVFTDAEKNVSIPLQLGKFAAGRVATGVLELLFTPLCTMVIGWLVPATTTITILMWNLAEFLATLGVAVVVVILNYIFSKIFVFKRKK